MAKCGKTLRVGAGLHPDTSGIGSGLGANQRQPGGLGKVDGLEVLMGEARFIGPNSISIGLEDGDQVDVEAETVFVNVGERPATPDLKGLDSVLDGD
ncbi:hypothetical protein LTR08_004119 [Meristemomyces frigidus]|nr:hypothetical protein LTR08_004119 [Meristemomyces frigidus]